MLSHEPLNVLLVSTQRQFHGGEQQAEWLLDGLSERGHRCHALLRRSGQFAARAAGRAEGRRWQFTPFAGRGLSIRGWLDIRRTVRQHGPNVIMLNDPHAVTAWATQRPQRLWLPSRRTGDAAILAARRVDFSLRAPALYTRTCDALLCVSAAIAQQCRQDGIPAHQLVVVHDGTDQKRTAAGSAPSGRRLVGGLSSTTRLLVSVARLADHKGHRYLIDAFPQVLEEFPDTVLALAGDGDQERNLRRQAAALGVADRVRFLGHIAQVPDLLAAADLFVLGSHMEGLCSSIIDAMLARCAVVATSAGGIPELLRAESDGEEAAGWMVPPHDATALAGAITEALQNAPLRHRRIAVAFQRAQHHFTTLAMVDRTEQVMRLAAVGKLAQASFRPTEVRRGRVSSATAGSDAA